MNVAAMFGGVTEQTVIREETRPENQSVAAPVHADQIRVSAAAEGTMEEELIEEDETEIAPYIEDLEEDEAFEEEELEEETRHAEDYREQARRKSPRRASPHKRQPRPQHQHHSSSRAVSTSPSPAKKSMTQLRNKKQKKPRRPN
jgi:hypothetical protein